MTVELNGAFVPQHLRSSVEHYLRNAWARANFSPEAFRVRWLQEDPGDLVIGIEFGKARLLRKATGSDPDRRILGRALMGELADMLSEFLRVNHA